MAAWWEESRAAGAAATLAEAARLARDIFGGHLLRLVGGPLGPA